jgi:hypothetical protein
MISTDIGVWIAALATIGLFSWMWKENPWFRMSEHMFVGAALGHLATVGLENIQSMAWKPLLAGKTIMLLPFIGGLLLYTRWSKRYSFMSRIPMGFIMGVTASLVISGAIKSNLIDQVNATMLPWTSVNNIIFLICCLSGTAYFLFSPKAKWFDQVTYVGRYSLMCAFGAAFGYTVMSRIALFTGRMQFLLTDWIKIMK